MSEPKKTNRQRVEVPPVEALEAELGRMRRQGRRRSSARSTVFTLLIVAAIAVILTILILPVLTIQGVSMEETLFDGDVVVALNNHRYKPGDVIGFYYNNEVLIKRVIATETDWVDIDQDGTVYVNNVRLDEPYIHEKAFGECNINLPYQVPEGCCFVLGYQHRQPQQIRRLHPERQGRRETSAADLAVRGLRHRGINAANRTLQSDN